MSKKKEKGDIKRQLTVFVIIIIIFIFCKWTLGLNETFGQVSRTQTDCLRRFVLSLDKYNDTGKLKLHFNAGSSSFSAFTSRTACSRFIFLRPGRYEWSHGRIGGVFCRTTKETHRATVSLPVLAEASSANTQRRIHDVTSHRHTWEPAFLQWRPPSCTSPVPVRHWLPLWLAPPLPVWRQRVRWRWRPRRSLRWRSGSLCRSAPGGLRDNQSHQQKSNREMLENPPGWRTRALFIHFVKAV